MSQFKTVPGGGSGRRGGDIFGIDIGLDPLSAGLIETGLIMYWPSIIGMVVTFTLVLMGNQKSFLIAGSLTFILQTAYLQLT